MKESDQTVRIVPVSHTETRELAAADPVVADPLPAEQPAPGPGKLSERKAEMRSAARYPFSASAEAFEPRTRTRISGRLADLGVGGCYIDTVSPFSVGTAIRLRLTSEGRVFQAAAVVTYSVHSMGMGLAFTRMSPNQANLLASWLGELSGEVIESDWEPEAEPPPAPLAEPAAGAPKWLDAARELVELLRRKHILTEAESEALQKKMSG